jgi:hypothetical protein
MLESLVHPASNLVIEAVPMASVMANVATLASHVQKCWPGVVSTAGLIPLSVVSPSGLCLVTRLVNKNYLADIFF